MAASQMAAPAWPGRGAAAATRRLVFEQGAFTGQERADLGRDLAQLVGRVHEADVIMSALGAGRAPSTNRAADSRWRVAAVIASVPWVRPQVEMCDSRCGVRDAGLGEQQGRVQPPIGQGAL